MKKYISQMTFDGFIYSNIQTSKQLLPQKGKKDKNWFRTWSDITVLTFFSLFINPHGLPMMRFGMTWDWVNDGTIFSCLRETPLKAHWVITHWTICIIYDNCLKKNKKIKKEILKTGLFKLESRDPLDSGDFTNPVLCTSTYIFKTKKSTLTFL